jgi:hypothetical protein
MTHKPNRAEQIIMSRDAIYIRRRLKYDYKVLCRRARDERLPIENIIREGSRISNITRYVKHFEDMHPVMFNMKLRTLASYADAITRLNIKNAQFFYHLAVVMATITDDELTSWNSITPAGNLAYIIIKSPHAGISKWASRMLKRFYYASRRHRDVVA